MRWSRITNAVIGTKKWLWFNNLIVTLIWQSVLSFSFPIFFLSLLSPVMNSTYTRPIVRASNGGINASERTLRIIFPAFSSREFGCVCFCVIMRRKNRRFLCCECGAFARMHRIRRIAWSKTQTRRFAVWCRCPQYFDWSWWSAGSTRGCGVPDVRGM